MKKKANADYVMKVVFVIKGRNNQILVLEIFQLLATF